MELLQGDLEYHLHSKALKHFAACCAGLVNKGKFSTASK